MQTALVQITAVTKVRSHICLLCVGEQTPVLSPPTVNNLCCELAFFSRGIVIVSTYATTVSLTLFLLFLPAV